MEQQLAELTQKVEKLQQTLDWMIEHMRYARSISDSPRNVNLLSEPAGGRDGVGNIIHNYLRYGIISSDTDKNSNTNHLS